jgi:signal transduction histidine kinase
LRRLTEVGEQSRQAAILAESNRMARDVHGTLAQGFTGVIVQLEAAVAEIGKLFSEDLERKIAGDTGAFPPGSMRKAR